MRVVTFGEIMMRLATPGRLRFSQAKELELTYGGGEANVAVSLAALVSVVLLLLESIEGENEYNNHIIDSCSYLPFLHFIFSVKNGLIILPPGSKYFFFSLSAGCFNFVQ